MYQFTSALIRGKLIKRYKRFLADILLDSGELITAHCPNTGAMTGCAIPNVEVYVSKSNNPKRKYLYTWEYSSDLDGHRIGINTANANKVVKDALLKQYIVELASYGQVISESKLGKSRIDFLLQETGLPDAYLEVKSVTLAEQQTAFFPDTVTVRGQRHCEELARIAQTGQLAFLFFCIQRENISTFCIAKHIDKKYAEALEYAKESGVQVLAYQCHMSHMGIKIIDPVQIT